jgi:hypothetical protein
VAGGFPSVLGLENSLGIESVTGLESVTGIEAMRQSRRTAPSSEPMPLSLPPAWALFWDGDSTLSVGRSCQIEEFNPQLDQIDGVMPTLAVRPHSVNGFRPLFHSRLESA